MDVTTSKVAVITGGSQSIGAGLVVWLTRRVIAEMAWRYGGHVVNISASLAEVANSRAPSVLAALTKGGLAAATRSLAVECRPHGWYRPQRWPPASQANRSFDNQPTGRVGTLPSTGACVPPLSVLCAGIVQGTCGGPGRRSWAER